MFWTRPPVQAPAGPNHSGAITPMIHDKGSEVMETRTFRVETEVSLTHEQYITLEQPKYFQSGSWLFDRLETVLLYGSPCGVRTSLEDNRTRMLVSVNR